MTRYEIQENDWLISTDPARLDRAMIHEFLSTRSYWAKNVAATAVNRSLDHSLCFGVYRAGRQIGFARVITDYATFAWLADVFIVEEQRGHGFGRQLISAVLAHPGLQGLRRFMLATADAHALYQQFGFLPLKQVERFMEFQPPNPYKCGDEHA